MAERDMTSKDAVHDAEPATATPTSNTEGGGTSQKLAQAGFLFVQFHEPNRNQTRKELSRLRGHVMHNYLKRKQEAEYNVGEESPEVGLTKDRLSNPRTQDTYPSGGQKMRFRLKSGGMELRPPYRYDKTRKGARSRESTRNGPVEQSLSIHDEEPTLKTIPTDGDTSLPLVQSASSRVDAFGVLPIDVGEEDERLLIDFRRYRRFPWW
jgi:hypothetical protein